MKMAFFAATNHGMVAGFCPYREDGVYQGFEWDWDDEETEEEHFFVVDVVDCETFNDAKRHQNVLAGRDPEEGIDAWGDSPLGRSPSEVSD